MDMLPFPSLNIDPADHFGLMRTIALGDFHFSVREIGSESWEYNLRSHAEVPKTIVSCQMTKDIASEEMSATNHFSNFTCDSDICSREMGYAILFRILVAYLNAMWNEEDDITWSHFSFYQDADVGDPSDEQLIITSGCKLNRRRSNWNSVHLLLPTPELRNWIECDPTCPSGNERIQYSILDPSIETYAICVAAEPSVIVSVVVPQPSREGGNAPTADVFFYYSYCYRYDSAPPRSYGRRRLTTSFRG